MAATAIAVSKTDVPASPSSTINAFAATEAKGPVKPFTYEPRPLQEHDIKLTITHCGVCATDLHLIENSWKMSQYPLVPGHEIVGVVSARGSAVSESLRIGSRVGVGPLGSTCHNCDDCKNGIDQCCTHQKYVMNSADPLQKPHGRTFGGFAKEIVVDSRFAYAIPDGLASDVAAPLLCGGATVWNPLVRYGKAGARVGVIGIGGLGHMALMFGSKLGYEMIALTSTPDKAKAALQFGAKSAVVTTDAKAVEAMALSFDLLISTVDADLNWSLYISLLRTGGTLIFVGVPPSPLSVPVFPLLFKQLQIGGSATSSPAQYRAMLQFAATHDVAPLIERFEMTTEGIAEAFDRVKKNTIRYRGVLCVEKPTPAAAATPAAVAKK